MIKGKVAFWFFSFLIINFLELFLFSKNVLAYTQCEIDGGACLAPLLCAHNCFNCDTYEFRNQAVGYYLCGEGTNNGQVCCDSEGYPGFCNDPPVGGTGPNACYDTDWNGQGIDYNLGGSCQTNNGGGTPPKASCPNCDTGNSCNQNTCNAPNSLGTNHCGYTSGTMACTYHSYSVSNWTGQTYCNPTGNRQGCQNFYNNCSGAFACVGNSTCERTMGGIVTDIDSGAPLAGVAIAGGGTTGADGKWSRGGMAYGAGFTFTAPTNLNGHPCDQNYLCHNPYPPTPGSISGTVGGGGDCGMNCNFKYKLGFVISGTVFNDYNNNGIKDNSPVVDTPRAGVTVSDGTDTTVTDANGNFSFPGLYPGTYNISVIPAAHFVASNSPKSVTVNAADVGGVLMGITPLNKIGGTVFIDYNANGLYDTEDYGFTAAAMNIKANNGAAGNDTTGTDATNSLANPSFENGNPPTSWNFGQTAPAAGSDHQDAAHTDGTHSLRMDVTASDPNYWDLSESQTQPITYGTTYTVRFDAKAAAARSMYVYWQQTAAPWTSYFSVHPSLTTSWKTFVYTFSSNATDATAALHFEFAETTGSVYIDNVSITTNGTYAVIDLLPLNTYSISLATAVPAGYKLVSASPISVNLGTTDISNANFALAPLFTINGNVYNDINKNTCWNPSVDIPLYTQADTSVVVRSGTTGNPVTGSPFAVDNTGHYSAINLLPDANGYIVSYVQNKYYDMTTRNQFSVKVGTPGKSIHCDVSSALNPACN